MVVGMDPILGLEIEKDQGSRRIELVVRTGQLKDLGWPDSFKLDKFMLRFKLQPICSHKRTGPTSLCIFCFCWVWKLFYRNFFFLLENLNLLVEHILLSGTYVVMVNWGKYYLVQSDQRLRSNPIDIKLDGCS